MQELTLNQGLSIDEAETINLVVVSPIVEGVQDELAHHRMAAVEQSIVAVVGGSIQAPQGGGLGPLVGALTGEAILHLWRLTQLIPS